MWFWDWARWEQEIDWAVLWGVNLVLAYTGQEEIFKGVYNGIGMNDSGILATLQPCTHKSRQGASVVPEARFSSVSQALGVETSC